MQFRKQSSEIYKIVYWNKSSCMLNGFEGNLGTLSSKIWIKDGTFGGGLISEGISVVVEDFEPNNSSSLLQYKASESIPNLPGRQFIPSFKCSTSGPKKPKKKLPLDKSNLWDTVNPLYS